MATKSGQQEAEKAEVVEELLDALDAALDRVRVLYEQYFLGIQKQPPTYLHTDVERKIRDLVQLQVRNTALRYRFATLQQKFGSYNAYWRRTLRQIEAGTYTRNLSKIGRQAARTGATVPEEILAAMPKRMREQVKRDREAVLALAELRGGHSDEPGFLTLADEDPGVDVDVDVDMDDLEPAASIGESAEPGRHVQTVGGAHEIDQSDAEFDVDAFFAAVTSEGEPAASKPPGPAAVAAPVVAPAAPPVAAPATPPVAAPAAPPVAAPAAPPVVAPAAPPVAAPAAPAAPPVAPLVAAPVPPRPSAGQPAGQAPSRGDAPPPVPRSLPSRVVTPPVGITLPSSAGKPSLPKPPLLAPSQATRPVPASPGAAAARTAPVGEALAGSLPRLPSLPPLPGKRPAASDAPPDAVAPADEDEPTLPVQVVDRAEPPPIPNQAPNQVSPVAAQASPGERPSVPSIARPSVPSIARPPVPSIGRPPGERPPAVVHIPPSERPPPPRPTAASAPPAERLAPEPRPALPPGMSDADVDALYAKYVQAKQSLGEEAGPGTYGKLIKTINAQAPKIMEQYDAEGVDFSVIVKDNQVIIRAKPKP